MDKMEGSEKDGLQTNPAEQQEVEAYAGDQEIGIPGSMENSRRSKH